MEEAQEFVGGMAIRRSELDNATTKKAQKLAQDYVDQVGIAWSPVVIISQSAIADWPEDLVVEYNAADSIIRLPIPRWEIWYLPLIAHDAGFWVAKRGQIDHFVRFVDEQTKLLQRLAGDHPLSQQEIAPFLPELRSIWESYGQSVNPENVQKQLRPTLELYASRQKIHLWRLIADAFATYILGPAYAYALLFLILDPTSPFIEGESAREENNRCSRYLPSDARRAAIVFYTLREMDMETKEDTDTDGLFNSELRLLESVWEHALEITGHLEDYYNLQKVDEGWHKTIYEGLQVNFGWLADKAASSWREAKEKVVPVLQNGTDTPLKVDLPLIINAAWWCRPRYSDQISSLSKECARLQAGLPLTGLLTKQSQIKEEAGRLLNSRLYDIETDLERIKELFSSEKIQQADRYAVAGRFYRVLSEQDYDLKELRNLISIGEPLDSSLAEVIRQSDGVKMDALRREVLDFLGGVLTRERKLDHGICALAEALLRDYARMTGVRWDSRVILGANPLFSAASDIVHLRFPDWDIWSLPLMAHEFGHLTALATPDFEDLSVETLAVAVQGHPEADSWNEDQVKSYLKRRARHLHEFFADAFAVYCQGPAFAYNAVLLHFNPVEAYSERGHHPTHAERVAVILRVLEAMNEQEKRDEYENGPYESVIKRLHSWWSESVKSVGAKAVDADDFQKLKAEKLAQKIYDLLNKYYRYGAQYQAQAWEQADDTAKQFLDGTPDLREESLRNLLNIAWAGRVRYPNRSSQIAKTIRSACEKFSRRDESAGI